MATTEHEVLRIIGEKGKVGKTEIVHRLDISSGYVDIICKSLIREGFLKVIERKYYTLASRGAKTLAGEGFKMVVDKAVLEEVAKSVAKEVAKEIKVLPIARESARSVRRMAKETEEDDEEIKIKTSFIPPIELENAKMESNLEKVTTEEKGKFDMGGTVEALKKVKK